MMAYDLFPKMGPKTSPERKALIPSIFYLLADLLQVNILRLFSDGNLSDEAIFRSL